MSITNGLAGRARRSWADPLLRNSIYITATSAAMGFLGFLFWLVCAHLVSASAIGIATTLVTATSMISYLSLLGFNSTFIDSLPLSRNRDSQISSGLLIVFGAALIVATAYVAVAPLVARQLADVTSNLLEGVAFVVLTAFAAVNLATDSIFIAYRAARVNLIVDGFIQGLIKVALPVALVGLGAFGIYAATGVAAFAAVVASIVYLVRDFDLRPQYRLSRSVLREVGAYTSVSYVANLLNILPVLTVPLIVVRELGPTAAGYYYVAFQVANLLNSVTYAVSQSLFAEGSYGERSVGELARHTLRLLLATVVPAAFLLAVASPALLYIFGDRYEAQATDALIVLALAAPAVALSSWTSSLMRLTRQLGALVSINAAFVLAACGLTALFVHRGLVWVALAWLLGHLVAGALGGIALLVHFRRGGRHARHRRTPEAAATRVDGGPARLERG